MALIEDAFDENYIDPEVEEYFNFLDADEQEQTGFLNKNFFGLRLLNTGNITTLFAIHFLSIGLN